MVGLWLAALSESTGLTKDRLVGFWDAARRGCVVGSWVAAIQHTNGGVVDAVAPCGSDATLSQRGWTTTRPNHLVAVLTDSKRW